MEKDVAKILEKLPFLLGAIEELFECDMLD
jgi:hypothetical protein